LGDAGVAVWDVMRSCTRESSLDSDIVEDSIVANDFRSFFGEYGGIERVYFNGAKAEDSFRRYVFPGLDVELEYLRLPSTSPANAGLGYGGKLEAWRVVAT
jgi:double-stranded uracil-DNA glycosylase